MLADLHVHSIFSFDGKPDATPQNIAERAIAAGLSHIAITDHCDIDCELAGIYPPLDKETAFRTLQELREAYRGRLEILVGLELGGANHCPEEAKALLSRYPYDIVLGSVHNLLRERDFYYFDFSQLSEEACHAYFRRVIAETMELCDFDGIQVITHLTYMDRYMHRHGKALDIAPHRDALCRLFEKMQRQGLVLELNTSCLDSGLAMPSAQVLALYRACGGTRVCLGSDAHTPARITQSFAAGCALLGSCGFTELSLPLTAGYAAYPIPREESQ